MRKESQELKDIREELNSLLKRSLNGTYDSYKESCDEIRNELKDMSTEEIKILRDDLKRKLNKKL